MGDQEAPHRLSVDAPARILDLVQRRLPAITQCIHIRAVLDQRFGYIHEASFCGAVQRRAALIPGPRVRAVPQQRAGQRHILLMAAVTGAAQADPRTWLVVDIRTPSHEPVGDRRMHYPRAGPDRSGIRSLVQQKIGQGFIATVRRSSNQSDAVLADCRAALQQESGDLKLLGTNRVHQWGDLGDVASGIARIREIRGQIQKFPNGIKIAKERGGEDIVLSTMLDEQIHD